MSVTPTVLSTNATRFTEDHDIIDMPKPTYTFNAFLFSLTLTTTIIVFVGSIYSLLSLLKMKSKSTLTLLVTSLAVDDLVSVVPVSIFMLQQWTTQNLPQPLCSAAAFLYLFQGISNNLKASSIICYNFCTMNKLGSYVTTKMAAKICLAILIIWIISILISAIPFLGWGSFHATSWGCLTDYTSSFVLFLFGLYCLCFCILVILSAPLTHQLLCSDSQQQLQYMNYKDIAKGYLTPTTPLGSNASSVSPDNPLSKSLKDFNERCVSLEVPCKRNSVKGGGNVLCSNSVRGSRNITVLYAQKRFSLILALTKVILWLPIMIQMLVQHIVGFQSLSFETLSFILTLLSGTTTPLFVLSKHWSHLPCGCIINCKRNTYDTSEENKINKRGFDFNLSFNKGYGIYKISQENHTTGENSTSYHNLINNECENITEPRCDRILNSAVLDFSSLSFQDRSIIKDVNNLKIPITETTKLEQCKEKTFGRLLSEKIGAFKRDDVRNFDKSTFFEGQERRLSHEEGRKPELTDWEWCRSKSERTPRQRSGGALAIPLCAFQGTVSLQAPTGKTLSLSTYEISSEGQKITPTSKKIEVYRSKSVGHEPNKEDSPNQFPDTNVKIHLEVLEICDNEEAMDTVSIISNISQSSTQARSPSLRYSRKENRFVSCDLGETASYSLFIPTNNPDSDINISIPDTVEAHRQNSKKQHIERDSYQEEIQLLNKAYRKRESDGDN
ncbi:hypothetical protein GDO86_010159 [Hymenochirus boettgeri]|uniref:G-protein coupled receptors family 1 profile domain-containing protein n=1 Tax=Hymenochirus boettgeri TaxID=247094 RepID=A0A8T2JRT6_9PIPI|nr:hypothetical protein GDO86_010159 [Hymenochirus boettgeri]